MTNKLERIENRENNIKIELTCGLVALIFSLIFVFSNHVGHFYQIYYVIIVFIFHQIIQAIIFNRWNINTDFSTKKIGVRILIIISILFISFMDLGKLDSHYSFYFGFTNPKKSNTFLSIVLYCGIYFTLYFIRSKKLIGKNKET